MPKRFQQAVVDRDSTDSNLTYSQKQVDDLLESKSGNLEINGYKKVSKITFEGKFVNVLKNPDGSLNIVINENKNLSGLTSLDNLPPVTTKYVFASQAGDYELPVTAGTRYNKVGVGPASQLILRAKNADGDYTYSIQDHNESEVELQILDLSDNILESVSTPNLDGSVDEITVEEGNLKIHHTNVSVLGSEAAQEGKTPGSVELQSEFTIKFGEIVSSTGANSIKVRILIHNRVVYTSDTYFLYTSKLPTLSAHGIDSVIPNLIRISGLTYFTPGTTFNYYCIVYDTCAYVKSNETCLEVTVFNEMVDTITLSSTSSGMSFSLPGYNENVLTVNNKLATIRSSLVLFTNEFTVMFLPYGQSVGNTYRLDYYVDAVHGYYGVDDNSSDLVEDFTYEVNRCNSDGTKWDSLTNLFNSDGLLVQNGKLMHPSQDQSYGTPYSTLTGDRVYYRRFGRSVSLASWTQFDIEVEGLTSFNENELTISAYPFGTSNPSTQTVQLNKPIGTGNGVAQSDRPLNGKWTCIIPSYLEAYQSGDDKGMMMKIEIKNGSTLKLGKITLSNLKA